MQPCWEATSPSRPGHQPPRVLPLWSEPQLGWPRCRWSHRALLLAQGGFPLHWPLINRDHMRDRLGQKELERKRVEDSNRLALEDPNFRC